jgi:hypothetical protein
LSFSVAKRPDLERGVVLGPRSKGDWPFDGEYWRDELGYYRQVVVNRCPKR